MRSEVRSSIGRAPVSKTGGWGFDSLRACAEMAGPRLWTRDVRWLRRLLAPIVYRLGHHSFKVERGVRFSLGACQVNWLEK